MISEALQAVSEGLFRRLFRFVFRYDIFISYARGDGARYAVALKDQLTKLDFACFLDVEELPPGNALTRTLRRALNGSATLVVVVTERAIKSTYCALELERFAATQRAIVPIDFAGTVARAPWPAVKDRELVWIDETPDALARALPSPIVADSIDRLFKYTRRNVRVRGQWIGVLVLFLIGAAVATFVIRQQVNEARVATIEAQRQEAIALENAARARQEQRKAEAQTRLALSNAMAIDARTQIEQRPISALLLAAEAAQVVLRSGGARAPAAEDALRQALAGTGGIPLTGHTATVGSFELSPDRRWLFTSDGGIGRVWSMREPKLDAPLHVLEAHGGRISAARFSPDSRWLATGGADGVVRIWDLQAAQPQTAVRDLPFGDLEVQLVSWSPDSRWIAASGERQRNRSAQLWDLSRPDPQRAPFAFAGHPSAVENVVFSPTGRWLFTSGSNSSYSLLWDMASGAPAGEPVKLPVAGYVRAEKFSNDGHWLAIGDSSVHLFDLTAPQIPASVRELGKMERTVFTVAFSPDSRWLAAGGAGRTAQLWDLSKPNPQQATILLPHAGSGTTSDATLHLAFDSGSRKLLTGITSSGGEGAYLWRLDQADVPASGVSLEGVGSYVTAAAFVSYDKVAVATLNEGLRFWNTSGGPQRDLPGRFLGHDFSVSRMVAGGNGEWLVTTADDSAPRFWNLRGPRADTFPQRLSNETSHNVRVVLSGDGRWLVSEYQDRSGVLVFASQRADARFARVMSGEGPFLAMSPDSRWLATSVSREFVDKNMDAVSLIDLRPADKQMKDGQLVGAIEQTVAEGRRRPSENRVTAAAFSPNSKTLATGRRDGLVRLWKLPVAADDKARELPGHEGEVQAMAFSRDGRWLVSGGADEKAILWDMTARNTAAAAKVLAGHDAGVHLTMFSPDGHWLFTGSRVRHDDIGEGKLSAFLWDLRQPGAPGTVMPGHEGHVPAADFSADGRWLATGSRVGSYLRLWDLTRADPATRPIQLQANNGPILHLNFSSDGRMLLTRSENDAMLWDMRKVGKAMQPFAIGRGMGDIGWAGFSPDNTMLITGGYREGSLYEWDITAKDPTVAPVPLRGDAGGFFAGAVSADSRVLVGTSNEGTKAWPLRPADLVAAACRVAGRNLTEGEWGLLVPGQAYRKTCAEYPGIEQ
jgi:WD40 repeat protein